MINEVLTEIKKFTYKDIEVLVHIDYVQGKCSIVESCTTNNCEQCEDKPKFANYVAKKWVFETRGLGYMNGWLVILDAMKFAITEAKKLLEASEKAKQKEIDKLMEQVEQDAILELTFVNQGKDKFAKAFEQALYPIAKRNVKLTDERIKQGIKKIKKIGKNSKSKK